ncbi:MAG: PqqD family protein [Bacteroidetes bacterium]|nr:PqqD family protein [Bacteroidota bacterium]
MKLNQNIAVSESGFVFNPTTGDSFTTNFLGKEVIKLLQEGKDGETLYKEIEKKFDVSRNILEKDVEDFKMMLSNYQILEND